jgi:mono/diheme cytochrome c family protein
MRAWLCLILLVTLTAGQAAAQESGDRTKGHAVARDVCARCHAVEGDEGRSPVSGAPSFRRIANAPDMSEIALSVLLRTPHKTMPNLTFEPDELRDVVAYIMSLRDRP